MEFYRDFSEVSMFVDLISIIVPIYNVKEYLSRCIDSILSQTYSNIEIILSDDGSTDGSSDICDEYEKKDKRIRVIHEMNKGLSEARNRGIRIARGKYLSFIDSDDWVSPNFILKLYYALIRTSSDISECLFKKTDRFDCNGEDTGKIESFSKEQVLLKLCHNNHERHVVAWNKLYKSELFEGLVFPLGKLHEDEFTTHLVFNKCKSVSIIYDELYFYYQNDQSIINKKINLKRLDSIEGIYNRLMFFKEQGMNTHFEYCSVLLFKQFLDFAFIPYVKYENKKEFVKHLGKKFKTIKQYIFTKRFSFEQKISFFAGCVCFSLIKIYKPVTAITAFFKKTISYGKRFFQKLFSMEARKEKRQFVLSCKNFIKNSQNKRRALILGAVEYANYGDLAIGESQFRVLAKKFNVFEVSQKNTQKYISVIRKFLGSVDAVFMPGGGNMSDIWRYDEDVRRLVIKSFPDKPIIIFPQSYAYTNESSNYKTEGSDIYNKHGNITIFARDKSSFDKLKEMFSKCDIKLAPDTVLLEHPIEIGTRTVDVGLCFRDDKESSVDTIKILISCLNLLIQNNISFKFLSTVEDKKISLSNRKSSVENKIQEISNCKFVITDRLHCGIFCMLTHTNCVILNNKNSKIKNFINTWNLSKELKLLDNSDIITTSFIYKALITSEYPDFDISKEFTQLEDKINQYAKI